MTEEGVISPRVLLFIVRELGIVRGVDPLQLRIDDPRNGLIVRGQLQRALRHFSLREAGESPTPGCAPPADTPGYLIWGGVFLGVHVDRSELAVKVLGVRVELSLLQ